MKQQQWVVSSTFWMAMMFVVTLVSVQAVAAPKASLNTAKLDFGKVRQGRIVDVVVEVSNTGDAPLELQHVQSSCPCATVSLPDAVAERTVQPGGMYPLKVTYDTTGLVGERSGGIVVGTNDPAQPLQAVELAINIEALVVTKPEEMVQWGMVPRGDETGKELVILPGDGSKEIELIDASMAEQTMTVEARAEKVKDGTRIKAQFQVASDVPLGPLANEVTLRVRVSGEEAVVKMPVRGEVVGDVLVMPQYIVCAPRLAYAQNQPLSEEGIIVRASREGDPLPDVLGVVAVGPLQCVIHKNVKPEWGTKADRHIIEVRTAPNAAAGAQAGTIHVMTSSKDQPVVSIPVYFRMDTRVMANPGSVVLEPAPGAPATQRILLHDVTQAALAIEEVKYEQDLLRVEVEKDSGSAADAPAAIVITATEVPSRERQGTMVSVVTNQPGAERVLIPVLIRAPQELAVKAASATANVPTESPG